MTAEKIELHTVREAFEAIDRLGSNNSKLMATRAIHINVLIKKVPGPEARLLKALYNDIGAEAAISSQAYQEEEGAVTDMIVMGTIYQHREVRRVLESDPRLRSLIDAIESVVENATETLR
jgi:hypothetical protein